MISRPKVAGKFLSAGGQKLWVRGVTYGTFRPRADGELFPEDDVVESDLASVAAAGLNAIRTYTVPPRRLLDAARRHHLRVMVGLPWEQHVAFLDDPHRPASIEQRVAAGVRACAGHPAVLCYAIGNEIPAPIVRWHGRRRIERFIERLYRIAKLEDPDGLVTYVNFPSTEYLELPFLDIFCFNVYLEERQRLQSYLARLHNLAGDKPLLVAEIGLDSRRNGEQTQADSLDWQIRTAAAAGCAGAFAFAWTDEWHRGGHDIEDWDFGLTRRDRTPKPALRSVGEAFRHMPPRPAETWPRISVVVCSCNGADTLRDCFDGLVALDYPDYEVIVVDDGSTDATAAISKDYPFHLIATPNRGLGSARNTGLAAATGAIIAYVDDDARPDPDWLTYLAHTFMTTDYAGVGGPNIAPGGDGPIADCVANAPGGPTHVLLSDREAEHIPGCNMAFRRGCLEAIDGFDPQFRVAGDDVDVCWRLEQHGWRLGFNPAAMVWHHRRNSLRAFWKQQRGYGRAEALLERKWPEKYNAAGHISWGGRIYGPGLLRAALPRRSRVYYGTWGTGLFQQLHRPAPGGLRSVPLMPEWYIVLAAIAALCALGALWQPLLLCLPVLVVGLALVVIQAVRGSSRASFATGGGRRRRLGLHALTAGLYLAQPLARLAGRLGHGLTPWRRHSRGRAPLVRPRTVAIWSEDWRQPEEWVGRVEARLLQRGAPVRRGGDHDRWDIETRGGLLGRVRLSTAVEEHGAGRQLARFRLRPAPSPVAVGLGSTAAGLSLWAAAASAPLAAVALACFTVVVAGRVLLELASGAAPLYAAIQDGTKQAPRGTS
ncbi:MAG TPA: glycosyltransferase [Thermoleophilaceae bacterium]|nr:glycosyltransferase [Thermoleophilaceae bacterium]